MTRTASSRALGALLLLAAAGCVPVPVEWTGPAASVDAVLADSTRLELAADGAPGFTGAWVPPAWPADPAACVASRRAARGAAGESYASWFAVRPDSSVVLRVARSDDGGVAWQAPVTADSTDVGTAGCARHAPFLSVDHQNGYVHVAYHLVGREGAGIFFAHSMDGGTMFHEPVPIVYGDRPGTASVASRGDTVVVAYEDPNSRLPRLGLAVSRTQGHIFEARMAASDAEGEARRPLVAVRGTRVVLAWTGAQRGGTWPRTMRREGTLVW